MGDGRKNHEDVVTGHGWWARERSHSLFSERRGAGTSITTNSTARPALQDAAGEPVYSALVPRLFQEARFGGHLLGVNLTQQLGGPRWDSAPVTCPSSALRSVSQPLPVFLLSTACRVSQKCYCLCPGL